MTQNNTFLFPFEKLEIWQLAIDLSSDIYNLTINFPADERFGITNQIRRASTSVSANIAEGSGRTGPKDKAKFVQIAYSSLLEVLSFLIVAQKLNFLPYEELELEREKIAKLANKINAFHKTLKARID